jgi:hypothetical protein
MTPNRVNMQTNPVVFIYGADKASRIEARRHVSRVVRARERQLRAQCQVAPKHSAGMRDTEDEENTAAAPHRSTQNRFLLHGIASYLDTTRRDPFNSMCVDMSNDAAGCLDHHSTGMAYVEHSVTDNSPLIPNRHLALQSALDNPMALHAIIATGALHRAQLSGIDASAVAAKHLALSISLVMHALDHVGIHNWMDLVQAMNELAACEEIRGDRHSCRTHLNGLRQLLLLFGGIEQLAPRPRLQLLVCFLMHATRSTYFPVFSLSAADLTWLCKGLLSNQASPVTMFGPIQTKSALSLVYSHVVHFCAFMNRIAEWTKQTGDITGIVGRYFRSNNDLALMITTTARDEQSFNGLGPKGNHRMATLFIICKTVEQLVIEGDRSLLELYLEKLQYLYVKNIRLFKFYVMQDGTEVKMKDAKLQWDVVRLMQIYKASDDHLRERISLCLVQFLRRTSEYTGPSTRWLPNRIMAVVLPNLIETVQ